MNRTQMTLKAAAAAATTRGAWRAILAVASFVCNPSRT
jgi:hypothetical protein